MPSAGRDIGSGALKRRELTGGCAYGIPSQRSVPFTVKPRNVPDERLTRGDDTTSGKIFRSDMRNAIYNILSYEKLGERL